MNSWFPYFEKINLLVEGRISKEDAERQERTAREILQRLAEQPGLILADEVGMGKTFVSLAVAVSVAFAKRNKPVVVMVPPSLQEKWPRDFEVFREKCLPPDSREKLTCATADRAVDFLKLIDDPPSRSKSIIFLTHGAMARGLTDPWTKLAIIRRALYRRRNTGALRKALCARMGALLGSHIRIDRNNPELWGKLLDTDTSRWLEILQRHGEGLDDDPVPEAFRKALARIETKSLDTLYKALCGVPRRHTKHYKINLKEARDTIKEELQKTWNLCMQSLKLRLPLLIFDEAHHLKNPGTNCASLFQEKVAEDDVNVVQGRLFGAFERMLFLTATPFQLGHYELCSVLRRFEAVRWSGKRAPSCGRKGYSSMIASLEKSLDEAQVSAIRFDKTWGRLGEEDLVVDGKSFENVEDWWKALDDVKAISETARRVVKDYRNTYEKMSSAEEALRPWVIRHLKPKTLSKQSERILRRKRFVGKAVLDGGQYETEVGIPVEGRGLLPFLVASRLSVLNPDARPVFAEGLASSFEAFRYTRANRERDNESSDSSRVDRSPGGEDEAVSWYLDRLDDILPHDGVASSATHPKISATVERVIRLWEKGEKVLVFCYYVATGKALRQHFSSAINRLIMERGARKLGCAEKDVMASLERLGDRISYEKSPLRKASDSMVEDILHRRDYKVLGPHKDDIVRVVRRFARTPSFLVRFFPLEEDKYDASVMERAFETPDASGLTLRKMIEDFFTFLVERCGESERLDYIEAVKKLQPGSHTGTDILKTYDHDELREIRRENLAPNVRLVYGETRQETRQRYMLAFNTPFYPEILVSSSVMAEGVDLHLNCRHVMHHDLCWNPSNLEQRTGRVDRIGSKAETSGKSIFVYMPYIAATQDEKMYRVVTDRERWFRVVMGESYEVDARTTDRLAERIPLPESIVEELAFKLHVHEGKESKG